MAIAIAIAMTLLVAEGAPFADYFSMNPDLLCPGATRAVTAALLGRAAIGDRFGRAAAFLVAAAPVTLPTSPVRGGRRAAKAATATALPVWLVGILFVIVLPGLAIGAQLAIRRRWPVLADGGHNDVAGFIIAVVGVLYAVLLAFVVIVSWENFSQAESTVGQEASALRSIYRESQAFPPDVREHIRADVLRYASTAVEVEWPAMADGQPGSPEVYQVLDDMSQSLVQLPATTPIQQAYVGAEADRFNQLVGFRSERLDYVEKGVPGVLWIALGVGAVVTIGFAMIFGLRSTTLHVIMTASLSAVIGVLLFVSVAIDHPFEGAVVVGPAPLERVISDFHNAP